MPRRFLSQVERERLSQFPDEVTEADCIVYFTLTPADMELISSRRGEENRLGMALLLCRLRYLGYFPASINHTPENVVAFVANQLQLSPIVLANYADRDETRREHLPVLRQHLDFRRVQPDDRESLIAWLGERALEHDRPSLLLQQACERLYQLRLVRPAVTTMEELVADARQWAEVKTIEVLVNPLPAQVQKSLVLVNFQYQQPLSQYWGSGTFSSSDGQRFAVARKTNKASPLPRYFGFGRGLSVITWTSDQLSQYRVLVTPPRIRESTFTLDAILDNETVLKIKEHTTDTAGYTDMMFALFDLLGMQFSPRLRAIGDYTLFRVDSSSSTNTSTLFSAKSRSRRRCLWMIGMNYCA